MSRTLLLSLAVTLALPTALRAQAQWLPPTEGASFSLEYVHPHVPEQRGFSFGLDHPWIQGAVFLGAVVPVAKRVRAVGELPLGVAIGRDNPCLDADCTGFHHATFLGNPYLGAEVELAGPLLRWTAGIRPPVQSVAIGNNDVGYYDRIALLPALYAASNDRFNAFWKGLTSLETGLEVRPRLPAGNELRLHATGVLVHDRYAAAPYEKTNHAEWRGGAQIWHTSEPLVLTAGVSALNAPSYPHRTTEYEWGAGFGFHIGGWLPLVEVRIPSRVSGGSRTDWYTLELAVQYRPR